MAITKQQARMVRQPTLVGDIEATPILDGTNTTAIIELTSVAEKVSFQSSGDLAGNIEFSINGITFYGSTAFTAGVPGTYSTNLTKVVKVTRTGGSGKLSILGR